MSIKPDPAAEEDLDTRFARGEGVPLYQFAPNVAPAKELPPPGKYTDPRAKLLSQVGSGVSSGLAGLDHLIANIAGMLDSQSYATGVSGVPRTEVFKAIGDWARDRQEKLEAQASEMAGGDKSLAGKIIRGAASSVTSLPVTAAATALGGPVGGMAALGALETADQGVGNAVKGAVEGAAMGKLIHVMGPAGRMIRIPVVMGTEYLKNVAQGVDPETALANAMNMGWLTGIGGEGKIPARKLPGHVRESFTPRLPETLPEQLQFKSTLNPTQQAAVDYLQEQGVPLTGFQQTGNRYLGAMEASTAHTPLGSQRAREFHAGTQEAMADVAGELAGKSHPEPVTPYEAGQATTGMLNKSIAELHGQESQAYKAAWEHAGKPEYDREVVVKTETEPLYDEAGEPTGERQVPTYKVVNMPVDVQWMKEIAREEIPNYKFMPAAEQSQSAAYSIYKALLKMDNFITAKQAEKMLQGFKAEAGYGSNAATRNESEAAAARIIPRLQKSIDAAVAETGRDAVIGLQEGRKLHAEKKGIEEITKKLREEPVEAFNQLSRMKDGGVDFLKRVAKEAPDALPKIARAYLDNLFEQATKEGGWVRADGVFRQWDKLGDQTKGMLFPDGQARALDRFFLASKITAERMNTSGTALVKAAQEAGLNPLKWLQGKFAGDILFSPRGIKFLTGIAQNPPRNSAEAAKLRNEAFKAFGKTKPPEGPPEGSGGPTTPPGAGGPPAGPGAPAGGAPAGAPPAGGGTAAAEPPLRPNEWTQDEKLSWIRGNLEAGNDVPVSRIQKRFSLGYGAAKKLLEEAGEAPAEGGGPAATTLNPQQHFEVQKQASANLPEPGAAGWRDKLNQASDQASERIDKFWKDQGKTLNTGLPVNVLADYSIVGARKIVDGAAKFADWSKGMVDTFGDQIKPHLKPIWKEAQAIAEKFGEMRKADRAAGSEQSTRVPTAVKATEDPLANILTTGYKSWSQDPEMMGKNVGAMLEYPNFRDLQKQVKSGKLSIPDAAEQIIGRIQENLQWLHDAMPAEFRDRARLWYDGAHTIARKWAKDYGATPEQVAATMAVTSPGTDWFVNAERGRRMLEFWQDRGSKKWDSRMEATWRDKVSKALPEDLRDGVYSRIGGKSFSDLSKDPKAAAVWFRLYDEAVNPREYPTLTPEGKAGDLARIGSGDPRQFSWSDFGQIRKGLSILEDGSKENIHAQLGREHKVRNFYNNIINPNSPRGHTTIDTHAVAAGLLRPLAQMSTEVGHNFGGTGSSSSSVSGESGTYGLHKEAYRRVAEANGLLPREMQSITWEAIRSMFSPEFKRSRANVEYINSLWKDVSDGKMTADAARRRALQYGGGFDQPAWFKGRWNPGIPKGTRSSSKSR